MSDEIRQAIATGRRTGLYPAAPSPRLNTSIDQQVAAAVDEISNLPRLPYPSTWSVVANHPGVLEYQVMTDDEYQQANKYDMLMRRLQAIQHENPSSWSGSAIAQLLPGGQPTPIKEPGWFGGERSGATPVPPYRYRGVFAPGQPGRTFMDLWMVPFSAVANNVVRPMADLDKAAEAQPAQLNSATGGLYNLARSKDMNPAWSGEQRFVEDQQFYSPDMLRTGGNPALAYRHYGHSGTVDGAELLGDFGYPDHWSRDFLGMALEAPFDFSTTSLGIMGKNAKRAMRYASPAARSAAMQNIGKGVAGEMAVPAAITGVLEAARQGR